VLSHAVEAGMPENRAKDVMLAAHEPGRQRSRGIPGPTALAGPEICEIPGGDLNGRRPGGQDGHGALGGAQVICPRLTSGREG
jgi:hypothetical protein